MASSGNDPVTRLGWRELSEGSWTELVERGLPRQLAELGRALGARNGRPVRVFTMPTLEAGIASLAVPFMDDDGILFDPALFDHPPELARAIAEELAVMLYPGWSDLRAEECAQVHPFASVLAPILLVQLPRRVSETDAMVAAALSELATGGCTR